MPTRQNAGSFRMKQIDELILRTLSSSIIKVMDIPDDLIFTITKVITEPDLSIVRIYYITNPEEKHAVFANILKKHMKEIREILGEEVIMRKTPKMVFIFDKNEAEALHMDKLLDSLK